MLDWQRLIDTCREGVWIIDAEARTTFANRRMADMLGLTVEEMLGRSLYEFMDASARQEAERRFAERREGISELHEFRLRRKDGSDLWTNMAANPQYDEAGRFAGALAMVTDITERKRTEESLREGKALYESLATALREGIVLQDADGRILACNRAAERILELSADQMMGRTSADARWMAIHEDGSPFPGEEHPAMVTLRTGRPCWNVTMGLKKPDGRVTWIEINAQPLTPTAALRASVLTSFADVAERKAAELALRQSEERFRTLAMHAPVGIFLADAEGRMTYLNKWYADLTGYSLEKLLVDQWQLLVHPDDRAFVQNVFLSGVRHREARASGSATAAWPGSPARSLRSRRTAASPPPSSARRGTSPPTSLPSSNSSSESSRSGRWPPTFPASSISASRVPTVRSPIPTSAPA